MKKKFPRGSIHERDALGVKRRVHVWPWRRAACVCAGRTACTRPARRATYRERARRGSPRAARQRTGTCLPAPDTGPPRRARAVLFFRRPPRAEAGCGPRGRPGDARLCCSSPWLRSVLYVREPLLQVLRLRPRRTPRAARRPRLEPRA